MQVLFFFSFSDFLHIFFLDKYCIYFVTSPFSLLSLSLYFLYNFPFLSSFFFPLNPFLILFLSSFPPSFFQTRLITLHLFISQSIKSCCPSVNQVQCTLTDCCLSLLPLSPLPHFSPFIINKRRCHVKSLCLNKPQLDLDKRLKR